MELKLTRFQWDELNRTFRELNDNAFLEDRNDLMSTVRRYEVCVMRMAMVLTRMEQYATGDTAATFVCPDTCFQTALAIVLCCYRHCRLLFTSFSNRWGKALQNPDNNSFPLDVLPDRFTHAEAVKIGESRGFGKRRTELGDAIQARFNFFCQHIPFVYYLRKCRYKFWIYMPVG